jgi:branched-chain amino acid transport system ATP-binding protein
MAELIRAEGLTAGYGDSIVLEDVSLAIDEGGSLALLGRNGVGKTTLLLTLMGLTRLQQGRLALQGNDITRLPRGAGRAAGWVASGSCFLRSPSRNT